MSSGVDPVALRRRLRVQQESRYRRALRRVASERGFKGSVGGWIYSDKDKRVVCQGWFAFEKKYPHIAEIAKKEAAHAK